MKKKGKKARMSRLNSTVNHISNEDMDDDFSKHHVTASFNRQSSKHLHLPEASGWPSHSKDHGQLGDFDQKKTSFKLTGKIPETIVKNSMESFSAIQ
mmetsp:Transcript_18941/g.29064  ORF Transcript_18941/g.29064 Transcript_18941/m.29064 type:complete len:97 (+) Transcript_18941:2523-2813(+)